MKKYFELNYDRHGSDTWIVKVGIKFPHSYVTENVIITCPVSTRITKDSKAVICGIGYVHHSRKQTVIE